MYAPSPGQQQPVGTKMLEELRESPLNVLNYVRCENLAAGHLSNVIFDVGFLLRLNL